MKLPNRKFVASLLVSQFAFAAPTPIGKNASDEQFMTTVQLKVQEPSHELIQRSIGLVNEEFKRNFDILPAFGQRKYEVKRVGDQIIFSLVTSDDLRKPMQHVVSNMIQHLNGRVRARGRTQFYKTAFTPESQRYFKVIFDDTFTEIEAASVPLRDLLRAIKGQVNSFSYAISTDCAERTIDWSYSSPKDQGPKDVGSVMKELASVMQIELEEREGGYFIFSGDCQNVQEPPQGASIEPISSLIFHPPENMAAPHQQVHFPLLPLTN